MDNFGGVEGKDFEQQWGVWRQVELVRGQFEFRHLLCHEPQNSN
jgi:hypothetical protein